MNPDSLKIYQKFKKFNLKKIRFSHFILPKLQKVLKSERDIKISSFDSKVIIDDFILDNPFLSKEVLTEIKNLESCEVFIFKIDQTNVQLRINYRSEDITLLRKTVIKILVGFNNFIKFMYPDNRTNKLDISLYLTDLKKVFPEDQVFTSLYVNSGSTLPGERLTIWRKEELTKVLIHELIHYYRIDFRQTPEIETFIRNNFNISNNSPIRTYEGYVETLAIILHSLYFTQDMNKFQNLINLEMSFSYYQLSRILKFIGCSSIEDFLKSGNLLKQKTSVFSYFFLKSSYLFNLILFLDFMINKNKDQLKFIKTCSLDQKFHSEINKWFLEKRNLNTMRMSLVAPILFN